MLIELKTHYGWCTHDVPDAATIDDAAYSAIRATHHFLTDDNHSYTAGEKEVVWAGKVQKYNSVLIYRERCAPAYKGPDWAETPYWFAVQYRLPTNTSITEEPQSCAKCGHSIRE